MAWDDPVVWILIIAVVVFLFGASRIPQFAKAIGQARKEFGDASKGSGESSSTTASFGHVQTPQQSAATATTFSGANSDPLVAAAQNEGIDVTGKSRDQIANELAWKLSKK
jgi:TatA/E family protein of Tat protein translocase